MGVQGTESRLCHVLLLFLLGCVLDELFLISHLQNAGHAFHSAALKLLGFGDEGDKEAVDQNSPPEKRQDFMPSSDTYSSKGKKKSGEGKHQDHYALLGLGNLRFLATEEQIRRSYREAALKHHPDKLAALLLVEETETAKQAKKDEIENFFKAIQEAYEVLIDPVKRRIYDSTDEFDDEIPTDCAPLDFFKVFGPAFVRNGRWSVNQPVPSLGEENTSLDEVDSLYNFWYSFKSWREFPHADEFDLEQAESRDHKRWMERQNSKLREKAKKEENARIRALVDNAYKRDPRIMRRKEEEKAEKQRKKEARFLAKKLQEQEAARLAEEERCKKEEEVRRAAEAALNQKKVKEKEKKLLRKERARLRTLSGPVVSQRVLNLTEDDVESICMSFETERLRSLCDDIENKEGIGRALLIKDALGSNGNSEEPKQAERNAQNNESAEVNGNVTAVHPKQENILGSYEKKEKPWGREEIELLRKGMQKYPKGTSLRWEVIADYIGTGRSVEEILKVTKTVLLQRPDSSKAFDSFLEKRKPPQTIASPLDRRQEADVPEKVVPEMVNSKKPFSSDGVHNPEALVVANGASSSTEQQDEWSAVQERALVQALKTFPKETSQRWERVTAAVPGKTVIQCKKKFAMLKENFRNKKNVG
ncbi:dnaJ homolog subfamily C member 2-like isoform X2 [Macadamia integrifolia]|uniref:dnaJ homolog subfamily C member 2-like isoform X2 n=1 Tax=Macadamia integrifolia TaxID=60698 RepID=UPI001C4E3BB4|nr:dnaJ homolog subfamily C member 2-like isoform X2 [Macadamia integrifolia]XP_042514553.1 dnaJ homolog subfamily C member 2-like isoform X2 [Macadamia integrifolia]